MQKYQENGRVLENANVFSQKGDKVKERIIKTASYLFVRQGYHGTGTSVIAHVCKLRKSSIFHYFKRKEDLALAAIEALHHTCKKQLFCYAYDYQTAPQQRLENFIQGFMDILINNHEISLVSCLATELVDQIKPCDEAIKAFFKDWHEAVKMLLISFHLPAKAALLTKDSMTRINGILLMVRIERDEQHIQGLCQQLRCLWLYG